MSGGSARAAVGDLVCCGLTVGYPGRVAAVLDGLSQRFGAGRFTALLGPNGCGKSTLLKAMLGLLRPRAGRITLGDADILGMPRRALARHLAYLPQDNACPEDMTVADLVALGGYARQSIFTGPSEPDLQAFRRALKTVGLEHLAHVPVARLSGGQRQRAWLALALAQDTAVLLLDEPVNALDLKYQYAVLDIVRSLVVEQGRTVVAVLHDLNLAAAFADDVVMLDAGRVQVHGPVRQAMTADNVARVFGLPMDIHEHAGRLVCMPRRGVAA